jgi:hypothetical protein
MAITKISVLSQLVAIEDKRGHNMHIDKALIYEAPGADPTIDRSVLETPDGRITIIALGHPIQAPAVAHELAAQGAKLIELCGGISPAWRPKVSAVVGHDVKVSSVTFGIESLQPAASYNQAFIDGKPPLAAFIILKRDAEPERDRFVSSFPPLDTHFIAVPDGATAAEVAARLAREGFGLIELYGGFSTEDVAEIIQAVGGLAPVGVGSFALDALQPGQHVAAGRAA